VVDTIAWDSQFVALDVQIEAPHLLEGFVGDVQLVGDFRGILSTHHGDVRGVERIHGTATVDIVSDVAVAVDVAIAVPFSELNHVHSVPAAKICNHADSVGRLYLFSNEFSASLAIVSFGIGFNTGSRYNR